MLEPEIQDWVPQGVELRAALVADAADSARVPPAPAEMPGTGLDLNRADLEDLIGLGLSIGQAARFVSQRERRGGISSLRELDDYYGLEPGVRETLRRRGYA